MATVPPVPTEPPVLELRSGLILRDFELHFINHDHDWEVTADPIRARVSDSEVREIPRASLRGVSVLDIERDELAALSVKETGFHLNHEAHEVDGRQLIRIPLMQIESLNLPSGGLGDDVGGKLG